ncbi:ferredoxin-NADP reductase [Buchnera aphidicola (Schlechtendalia chinensis)]|uniref:Flavodoxin/ferredoxin--NADP reductase n=2 Tax=Buchnera aphidicola TaxID=9 RepID=A0A172WED0_BUCSC|nr:FAD-binding oxidoreductase [Buchnera aphidicola]ANF17275.1 ferredoxin-NADP reductase [Buchnera aphidicola (Schlechtendalia chinensis)]
MNDWTTAKIVKVIKWKNNLFSLILNASIYPFIAGQFSRILYIKKNGEHVQRAYSYVNSPKNTNLEFYITLNPKGKLTKKLYNLSHSDTIMIKKTASGYFTLDEIPNCKNLWMFATGTGIGPYLSILQHKDDTERFKNIILVHAVRYQNDLTYLPLMHELKKKYDKKLHIKTIVSREITNLSLHGRIPELLRNKSLENELEIEINKNTCHIMLCGNPEMIKDTQKFFLEKKGMKKHFRKNPGQITNENYW